MKELADILKQFRLERDWTFERLSIYTGVSMAALSKIENKKCFPNARTLYKLTKTIPAVAVAVQEQEQVPVR